MRKNEPKTPLLAILRALKTDARRREFAKAASTTVGYLYQIAGCYRGRCTNDVARRIASASVRMATKYGTPSLTELQVLCMCPECAA